MEEQKDEVSQHIEARSGVGSANDLSEAHQPQRITGRMLMLSMYTGLASWIYNFDLAYGGSVLLMQPYNKAFGTCVSKTTAGVTKSHCTQTALQQGLVSVTLIFIALGGVISGFTGNYLGRRGTIQVGCLVIAVGAGGMLGTAGNFTAYLVCKCIGGVGLGHLIAAAPIYGAECVSANKRGLLMSFFTLGIGFGNLGAAGVCWGSSSYTTSNLSWKIPIICQIPLSFILGVGVLFFPESPRWLLVKGREEAAKKSFGWFYNKDPEHQDIRLQVQDVQYHIELEKLNGMTTSWTEIFRGVDLRRTLTSAMIMVGLAITGSKFIGTYGVLFLSGVSSGNPFQNNFIVGLMIFAGSIVGPLAVEYGGRRFSMLIGYACLTADMLIIAGIGSGLGASSTGAKTVLLVFIFLWGFTYGLLVGNTAFITAAELHSLRCRTYGQACTTLLYEIFGFAASFYTPYMLSASYGNMGLNVGYFFGGLTALMFIFVFFFVPETNRLTLEQIDDHFLSGRAAWRTSTGRNKKIARGEEVDHSGEHEYITHKSA